MDKKQEIISELAKFLNNNYNRYYIDIVFLYGSWAHGFPHCESDVDLAISFIPSVIDEQEIFELITDISYDISIVLKCEVNIIPIISNFRHPMLYYNAIIQGVPVFIGNYERYVSLKLDAIHQMEDFEIFGIPWQRKIAKNLMRR